MRIKHVVSRRTALAVAAVAVLGGTQLPAALHLLANATGAEKTVTLPAKPGRQVVKYAGHAPFNNDVDSIAYGQLGIDDPKQACSPSNTTLNDQHHIAVNIPRRIDPRYDVLVRFQINWTAQIAEPVADMALYVYGPDGKFLAASDGSQTSEGVNLTAPKPGVYDVLVCAFQTLPQGQDYVGTVTAQTFAPSKFPATRGVKPPTYRQYSSPLGTADDAGEPSIGNSWRTGHTFFTAFTQEYDVAFNDRTGKSSWKLVNSSPNASNVFTADPIGFTDSSTGRTFVSQLLLACSGMVYTDDNFATVSPSEGCGTGINGSDHQTIGGGPFPKGIAPTSAYPHAVYYCAQSPGLVLGGATCARSDDGGQTFNPPAQVYTSECSGIHGHIRVAPDGTAYLPNMDCHGKQGVAVSTDGGQTWAVRTVPDSVGGSSDPSVSVGRDGTVYFGYSDGTGKPKIAVSRDRGLHWSRSTDVGVPFKVHNSEFAEVIAGDGDRAAFAFLGTPTRGAYQAAEFGKNAAGTLYTGGTWHLYIATTYDRGAHWMTIDATPRDPVQRGCIWNGGGSNPCRNLLDFNDITIDRMGRVMVGFADGCVSTCVTSTKVALNTLDDRGTIVRQTSGKGLFRAYDGKIR